LEGDVADLARNLGVDLVYLDRLEEGLAHLHRALAISEETGQAAIKLQTLYSLALAEIEKGELEAAQAHAEALLQEARQTKSRTYEADALYALGLCYQAQGEVGQATQVWQQASFLAHETEQRWLLWQIHAELAKAAPEAGLVQVHRRIAAEVIEQIAYPIADEEMRQGFLQAPAVQEVLSQTES
jgi:tetratricopeptide (TPR) repeat protein